MRRASSTFVIAVGSRKADVFGPNIICQIMTKDTLCGLIMIIDDVKQALKVMYEYDSPRQ
jgi:hypothetical protein